MSNKGKTFPPEILTDDEVRALISKCSPRAPTGIRNRALITMLYRAGLRISEALQLRPKDVDMEAGTIRILHGKGDKARTVGIDDGALTMLATWLEKRATLGINGVHPIFCTLKGNEVNSAYMRRLLPRLAEKAGIEKRVHAHGLRHSLASQLREEGVDIGVISKQLGHSSIATTALYLDHIAPAQVVHVMRSRKWPI